MARSDSPWALLMVIAILALAAAFKPWRVLRHAPLQSPWLMTLVVLPWAWWARAWLPPGMGLHLSGACLLVLMFGWPLAMWTSALIGLAAALLAAYGPVAASVSSSALMNGPALATAAMRWSALPERILWAGMVPGTLALLLGLAVRRCLPRHLFVYILGRGFFTTVIALALGAAAANWAGQGPRGLPVSDWLLGHWLLAWGEGIATGMLVAIFVAFRPQWLLTYSDEKYLPGARR